MMLAARVCHMRDLHTDYPGKLELAWWPASNWKASSILTLTQVGSICSNDTRFQLRMVYTHYTHVILCHLGVMQIRFSNTTPSLP